MPITYSPTSTLHQVLSAQITTHAKTSLGDVCFSLSLDGLPTQPFDKPPWSSLEVYECLQGRVDDATHMYFIILDPRTFQVVSSLVIMDM